MNEMTIEATVANIETVTDFVNEQLEALSCPIKVQMQIDIAIDELFGNVVPTVFVFREEINVSASFDTFQQAFDKFVVAANGNALVFVVKVVIVEYETYRESLDDERR